MPGPPGSAVRLSSPAELMSSMARLVLTASLQCHPVVDPREPLRLSVLGTEPEHSSSPVICSSLQDFRILRTSF